MQQQMGKPKMKLIQETETRWNSTYSMFQRLLEQREAVAAALASLNSTLAPLNSVDSEAVSECLQLLAVFNETTVELSSEKRDSASKIIPLVRQMHQKILEWCE